MFFVDVKGILSAQNRMNLYRGCTHGCIYCDSRSKCYHLEHDFEDIEVKQNAPQLLENVLRSKRQRCMINTGSMCDPYMHCEQELQLTRKCLELIDQYEFGLAIQTKSDLILRDLDLLKSIHQKSKCVVQITLTTYDEKLCKILEPNVCTTKRRFEVLKILRDNGIPTVVWICPLLPFINDTKENLEGILGYCAEAKVKGIINYGMGMTLREGSREYFYQALDQHFPGIKEKYQKKYGHTYEIVSDHSRELYSIFVQSCRENHIIYQRDQINDYIQQYPIDRSFQQMSLFDI